jgi:hypothetical protein
MTSPNSITDIFRTVFMVAERIEGTEDQYLVLVMSKAPGMKSLDFLKDVKETHGIYRFVWTKEQLRSIVGSLRSRAYFVYVYSFRQYSEWSFPLLELPVIPFDSNPIGSIAEIANSLPEAQLYVEVFAGRAPLFCHRYPAPVEVLNDYAGWLVAFFRMLRSPADFHWFCLFTYYSPPWHRIEDHLFPKFMDAAPDALISTYLYYLRMWQVFARYQEKPDARAVVPAGLPDDPTKRILYAMHAVDPLLTQLHNRIYRTQIESLDPHKLLEIYDSEDTLFWVDFPTYLGDNTEDFMLQFLERLADVKGKVAIYSEQQTGNSHLDTLMRQQRFAKKLGFKTKRYGSDTVYRKNI